MKRLFLALVLSVSLLFSNSGIVAMAESFDDSSKVTSNDVVKGGPAFAGATVPGAVDSGVVYINIPAGYTARCIRFIGNKEGGGANTTISFLGSGISVYGSSAPLNGTFSTISASSMSISGSTTLVISYDIADNSQAYNLVFAVYDYYI